MQDLSLQNKKLLLRVDFNVPQDKEGSITDDSRIVAALPSIRFALDHGAAVILMSHLGRPKGKPDAAFSLTPCAKRLSEWLKIPVLMAPDCVGPEVEALIKSLKPGQVILLENLRFHEGEEHPERDPSFAQKLAQLGDVYVNDAFGAAHRPHASITAITQHFPGRAAAGLLLQKEVGYLGASLTHPKRPFYTILGGAKISTKIALIQSLLNHVDGLFLGGAMAFTFLKAQGIETGASLCEDEFLSQARDTLRLCQSKKVKLWLPVDVVIMPADQTDDKNKRVVSLADGIPEGYRGVDIGPATIALFTRELQNAGTIFWNGPMGIFEIDAFAQGTYAIAKALATSSALTLVGGGDSVAAVNKMGLADQMDHLSTGGGAALEFIENGTLVGVEALTIIR